MACMKVNGALGWERECHQGSVVTCERWVGGRAEVVPGSLAGQSVMLQGSLTEEWNHLQYLTSLMKRRQTQTGEESIKNASICNRWFVSADLGWWPGAIQICGRRIYNLYLKHRPGCSYFACMSERFLMWNYSTFTSPVWVKLCRDQWFNLN